MLLRVSGSLIPRCASSMIFSATNLVAGSSTKLKLKAEQTTFKRHRHCVDDFRFKRLSGQKWTYWHAAIPRTLQIIIR
jgi:hypothetical protein